MRNAAWDGAVRKEETTKKLAVRQSLREFVHRLPSPSMRPKVDIADVEFPWLRLRIKSLIEGIDEFDADDRGQEPRYEGR